MSLADAIYTHLKTREFLVGIVGDAIFYVDTDQENPPAAVFFEEVGENQIRPLQLSPVLSSVRVSFECWCDATAGGQMMAEALGREVYAAFINPNGSGALTGNVAGTWIQDIRFESSRPLRDEATRKWGREIDLTFDCRL